MYGAPYIFYFVLPIVKRVKIMVQRVDFEQICQLLCPATVHGPQTRKFQTICLKSQGEKGGEGGGSSLYNVTLHSCLLQIVTRAPKANPYTYKKI